MVPRALPLSWPTHVENYITAKPKPVSITVQTKKQKKQAKNNYKNNNNQHLNLITVPEKKNPKTKKTTTEA